MLLYLRADLIKSESGGKAGSSKPADTSSTKGEQRGGAYVARAQVGLDSDGSPKYRYFKTEEEYEAFMAGRGKSKAGKELEHKVKQEHKESTEKQHEGSVKHQPASRSHSLLTKEKPTEKSLRLYVRI